MSFEHVANFVVANLKLLVGLVVAGVDLSILVVVAAGTLGVTVVTLVRVARHFAPINMAPKKRGQLDTENVQ